MRFSGYELCPFAEQVRLALAMSRQAYTFTEPSLPYWLVPDAEEQEYDGNEGPGKSNDDETSSAAESAAASTDPAASTLQQQIDAFQLDAIKLTHGDVVLLSSWEIFLYIDCILQAGSKVLKNRHTGAHRGAPPFFPPAPKDRQRCLKLLRSLHGNLVGGYWDLVESLSSKEDYVRNAGPALEKVKQAATDVQRVLTESNTSFAFGLRRAGMLEAWCGPLFNRLRTLGLWKPSETFAAWLDLCSSVNTENEAGPSQEGGKSAYIVKLREFHTAGAGKKRPSWVDASPGSTW